jgi:hypothetical protein
MKVQYLDEPELEFGSGRHIDIRFGLMNYGPLDCTDATAPRRIRVGIVGTSESIESLTDWLNKCRGSIDAKASRQPNLFPRFPGFNERSAFLSRLVLDSAFNYELAPPDINRITRVPLPQVAIVHSVEAFVDGVKHITEGHPPDVVLCAVPEVLMDIMTRTDDDSLGDSEAARIKFDSSKSDEHLDFHDLLKAHCMRIPTARPIQIVLPSTYDSAKRGRQLTRQKQPKALQDEATRAWNLHVALYYKAGGAPWRLHDESRKFSTCFVGIGFYQTPDRKRLLSSVAQVFNDRGTGMVVRGGPGTITKDDRQVHLSAEDAYSLLKDVLNVYRKEHRTLPARVVLHKTSSHNAAEQDGFRQVINEAAIDTLELLSLRRSFTRLFRDAEYPPLRGTLLTLEPGRQVLYTRGSVDFFATYPGMYMPRPVFIGCDNVSSAPRYLANEVLALTKMNWNNSQFDGGMPITVRAAQQVGRILRYSGDNEPVQGRYSFYM